MGQQSLFNRFDTCGDKTEAAMVFSTYKLQRILFYFFQGYKSPTIAKLLREKDGMVASRRGIAKFLAKYRETGSIGRRSGSGRSSKLTREVKVFVEEQMRRDDDRDNCSTTAHQLHQLLRNRGYSLSNNLWLDIPWNHILPTDTRT